MAEIPVERKNGVAWWMYVVGLLGLLAIVVFAMRGCDTTPDARNSADGPARIAAQASAPPPLSE